MSVSARDANGSARLMGGCSDGLLMLVAATAMFERRRNKLLDACVLDTAASNTGAPLVYIGVLSVRSMLFSHWTRRPTEAYTSVDTAGFAGCLPKFPGRGESLCNADLF